MSDGRFAGVDWASEEHAVCVVDEQGRIVEGRRYSHNEPGIRALCARLVRLRVALVALERPDGLVDRAAAWTPAWRWSRCIPTRSRRCGRAISVAGGKSDGFDSFVLAELARTDSHRFRVLDARQRPDQGAAGDDPRAGRARAHAGRVGQPAARSARHLLARRQQGVLRRSTRRSRWRSCGATPPRSTPAVSVSSASLRFSSATATPVASPRASCSPGCAMGPRDAPASSRRSSPRDRPRARLRAGADRRPDQRADDRDPPRARRAPRRANVPLAVHRPGLVAVRRDDDRRDRRLPRALPHLPRARRRRRPSPRRGRVRQSQTRPVPLGLRPPPPRKRSAPSPTQAAATTPGPPTSTTAPAPAAPATPTPPASSAAPGARSSGASGTTTTPTTPTNTPPSNASSQPKVDTGGLFAAAHDRSQSGSRRRLLFRSNRKRGLLVKIC